MTHIRKFFICLVCLTCYSSMALADSAEDYEIGSKAFSNGNIMDAMTPLKQAADKGHAAAQALLAHILDSAELDEDAVDYYRKSSNQGNSDGQFGLASMYAKGEGIDKNLDEARRLFTLAAKQGNKNAIVALAQAHISGGLGLDDATLRGPEALHWIRAAADINYISALVTLSSAYRTGKYGLSIDLKMVDSIDAKIHKINEAPMNTENITTDK